MSVNRSELPPGWIHAKLAEVARWGSGGTPSRSRKAYFGGKIPWIKTGELGPKFILRSEEKITQDAVDNSSAKIFPKGAVALAMYGATIGKASILGVDAATNQACAVGVPDERLISSEYLYFYLVSQQRKFVEQGQGGAQPNISQGIVKGWPIPLAPRAEQDRITAKVGNLIEAIARCRARLDRTPNLLRRFRETVLEAAVSGRLTEEWRERAGVQFPSEPDWLQLASLCSPGRVITYGVIKLGEPVHNGVPCLRTSNVRWLHLDTDGMKLIAPELSTQYPRTILKGSEVLVNVRGTLGGVVAVTRNMRGWNVSREVAVVPADDARINPRYLALWIAARRSQNWLQRVQKGVAYTGINIEDLRTLPVAVPSGQEQAEIVKRVVALFELADRIERKHQMAARRVERLSPAIVAKAFRGELVPQDPGEGAAKEMLERISVAQKTAELREPRATTVIVRGGERGKRNISRERDVRRRKRA